MVCSKCGASTRPDAKFCPNCGTSLSPQPAPRSFDRGVFKLFAIIIVCVVILGIAFAFFLNGTASSQSGLAWKVTNVQALTDESQEPLNYYGNHPIPNSDIQDATASGSTIYLLTFEVKNPTMNDIKDVAYDCDITLHTEGRSYQPYAEYSDRMTGLGIPFDVPQGSTVTFHMFFNVPSGATLESAVLSDSSGTEYQYIELALPK